MISPMLLVITRTFFQVFLDCSESLQEVIEAGIDELHDAIEVRSDFAHVTRDNQNIFSGIPGLQRVLLLV